MIVDNKYIYINDSELTDDIRNILSTLEVSDEGSLVQMYMVDKDQTRVPVGYLNYFSNLEYEDRRSTDIPIISTPDYSEYSDLLCGITLRHDDQCASIDQMLTQKRGILQLATGAGKTLIMAGYLVKLVEVLGYEPNTIILVPTVNLINQTIEVLRTYGINATDYRSTRELSGIQVTHPMSLKNDVESNPEHLAELKVLICDEGHHLAADTWMKVYDSSPKLEVSIALSASIIDPKRVSYSKINQLAIREAIIIGMTGRLLVNFPPTYYISNQILATPVVFRIDNPANEHFENKLSYRMKYSGRTLDYSSMTKARIESEPRSRSTVIVSAIFSQLNRKLLILISKKSQANLLLDKFYELGISDQVRCRFGGGASYRYDKITRLLVPDDEDALELLNQGKISIVIGTSVLYEGVDIKQLDAVLLFSVGKQPRVIIQSLGRVLRKSKTGRYAYIIDFTDHECFVFGKQSKNRRNLYLSTIGVNPSLLYDNVTITQLKIILLGLETGSPNR